MALVRVSSFQIKGTGLAALYRIRCRCPMALCGRCPDICPQCPPWPPGTGGNS